MAYRYYAGHTGGEGAREGRDADASLGEILLQLEEGRVGELAREGRELGGGGGEVVTLVQSK